VEGAAAPQNGFLQPEPFASFGLQKKGGKKKGERKEEKPSPKSQEPGTKSQD